MDLDAETLTFERVGDEPASTRMRTLCKTFDLDEFWPAISGGSWPEGFTVRRGQIYDGDGRLTSEPQDDVGDDR